MIKLCKAAPPYGDGSDGLQILILFDMKFVLCFAQLRLVPTFEAVLIGFLSTCSLAVSYYSGLWRLASHVWIYLLADEQITYIYIYI